MVSFAWILFVFISCSASLSSLMAKPSRPVCWPCSVYYSLSLSLLWTLSGAAGSFCPHTFPSTIPWSARAISLDNLNIFFKRAVSFRMTPTDFYDETLKNKFPATLKILKGIVFSIKWQTVLYGLLAGERNFIFDLILRSTYVSWVGFFFPFDCITKGCWEGLSSGSCVPDVEQIWI